MTWSDDGSGLEGDGFRLRRLGRDDAEELRLLRDDPDVRRWSQPLSLSAAEARAELEQSEIAWEEGAAARFAIVSPDGDFLGGVSLTLYGPQRASIGYDLLPAARGRGIAASAVRLASAWVFEQLPDLVRLELWTMVGNVRSDHVAERAGFQREGVLRARLPFGDELRDVTVFSRLRSDRP